MDRFILITRVANCDGSESITRRIVTLAVAVEHAVQYWAESLQPWIDCTRGLREALMSRGVGDAYDGPDYMLAGMRACDRFVYIGDVGDLANSVSEGPCVRVTASGRLFG